MMPREESATTRVYLDVARFKESCARAMRGAARRLHAAFCAGAPRHAAAIFAAPR